MYYHKAAIKEACQDLSIPVSEFELLDSVVGKTIIGRIRNKMGDRQNLLAFKFPYCQGYEETQKGFEWLNSLIGNYRDYVFFLVDPFRHVNNISIYKASPKHIQGIISECFGFEYCIVSLQLNWLIAEDHNSCFYFVGEYAIEQAKIKLLNESTWRISHVINKIPLILYVKSIWSPELKPIIGGQPSNVKDFYVPIEVAISEREKQGGMIFNFLVASPFDRKKINQFHNKTLMMERFDWEVIKNCLDLLIKEHCSHCCYWDEVEEILSLFLHPGAIDS